MHGGLSSYGYGGLNMMEVGLFAGTSAHLTQSAYHQSQLKALLGLWILATCYTAVMLSQLLPKEGSIQTELFFLALLGMQKTGPAIISIGVLLFCYIVCA